MSFTKRLQEFDRKYQMNHLANSSKNPKEKIAVFVDVQNLFYTAYRVLKGRIRYLNLLNLVVGSRKLYSATAYVVEGERGVESFVSCLVQYGYNVKVREKRPGYRCDQQMTVDAIEVLSKVDTVVLVTGDGDVSDLASYLFSRGVRVEVFAIETKSGGDFYSVELPDDIVFLQDDKRERGDEYEDDYVVEYDDSEDSDLIEDDSEQRDE